MSLDIKEVRVPTPRVRAERILASLEAHGPLNEYVAAGAISPNDGVAILRPGVAGMAMTLADGTISGETILVRMLQQDDPTFTAVLTPTNLTGGATLTFDAVGESAVLIWDNVAGEWAPRAGYSATLA